VTVAADNRELCPTEEDSGRLMSSECIVLLMLAGREGKGDRHWGWVRGAVDSGQETIEDGDSQLRTRRHHSK
jgi:hypothetical protein